MFYKIQHPAAMLGREIIKQIRHAANLNHQGFQIIEILIQHRLLHGLKQFGIYGQLLEIFIKGQKNLVGQFLHVRVLGIDNHSVVSLLESHPNQKAYIGFVDFINIVIVFTGFVERQKTAIHTLMLQNKRTPYSQTAHHIFQIISQSEGNLGHVVGRKLALKISLPDFISYLSGILYIKGIGWTKQRKQMRFAPVFHIDQIFSHLSVLSKISKYIIFIFKDTKRNRTYIYPLKKIIKILPSG